MPHGNSQNAEKRAVWGGPLIDHETDSTARKAAGVNQAGAALLIGGTAKLFKQIKTMGLNAGSLKTPCSR